MTGLHRKVLRDFFSLRAQVFTIAILIVGGISVMVSSWSSYESLSRARDSFYDDYRFADVFADLVRAPDSVLKRIEQIKGVERVESRIIKDALVDVPGQKEPALGRLISWKGSQQFLNLIHLRQGRTPDQSGRNEIVVHEAFAQAHKLKLGDKMDVFVGGQKRSLKIIGVGISPEFVYALSPVAAMPDDKHFGIFWIANGDLESWTGMDGAFNGIQVRVSDSQFNSEIKRQIDFILAPFGGIQSNDRTRQQSNMFVADEIRQQRVMAVVMPTIFLAVAMFILNVMLSRLVSLHRGAIATLKSLGYGNFSLGVHYFQLLTLILIAGVLPAIALGAWMGQWYANLYRDFFRFPEIPFIFSYRAALLGLCSGLVPGWIASLGALRRVFALQPAEALRPPTPPRFQKGIIEKVERFIKLSLFGKMVVRSLLFRPIRLSLNVLGIGLSLGILINGSFWSDVMDFMIDRQFHQMHREDLTVRLLHPRGIDVFSELQRIPGVLFLEGERTAAVQIQFQNHSREIGLVGWQSQAEQSRILDREGNRIVPRAGGVLLSRYFEKEFGLQAGDLVSFKSRQGAPREFQVPVFGFVDDLIGQQAYAIRSDLHLWLKENPVVDTIQLKIDPTFAESIYVDLKAMPQVAGVSIRGLLLKGFSETVADMILTFTIILYIFAMAIAGAVIYNSARISFSERSWELASLRILGLHIGPTFELLFLDVGLQVLMALIPGIGLGYFLSYLSTRFIHNDTFMFPLIIDLSTYASAVFAVVSIFLVSGIFLFRKVSALDFSEALKARE